MVKMEMPIHCPLCNDILVNDYGVGGYLNKNCVKRLHHSFYCIARPFEEHGIDRMIIVMGVQKELSICWNFKLEKTFVQRTGSAKELEIPFIEIDLQEPMRAINKVKALLPFA